MEASYSLNRPIHETHSNKMQSSATAMKNGT